MWFFIAPCITAGYTYRLVFPFEKYDAVRKLSWNIRTSQSEKTDDSHFECFETVGFQGSEVNSLPQPSRSSQSNSLVDHFESSSIEDHAVFFENERQDNVIGTAQARDLPKFGTGANEKGDRWGCVHDYATCPHFNHDLRIEGTLGSPRLSMEVHQCRGQSRPYTPDGSCPLDSRRTSRDTPRRRGKCDTERPTWRVAADFAKKNDRNDEEREYRHVDYAEKPFKSKSRRRHIRALLGVAPPIHSQLSKTDLANLFQPRFVKSPDAKTALLINPNRGIPIARQDQTVGVLLRGRPFEAVVAVGGWAGIGTQSPLIGSEYSKLDSNYWAYKTLSFAKRIGFVLEPHEVDPSSA
ncbi:hypothetical protein CSAL01_11070 [Colletotrichum salicis]|uniref:Uncharacterized protein n=1 Tax=Colletotrichum salicis TaxID=1209931 RepID=A0A135URV3_9PEZI|nr:hypothetical protein CSAL01_11070 [Colletotrichum salicis]